MFLGSKGLSWLESPLGPFMAAGDLASDFQVVGVLALIILMAGVFVGVFIVAGDLGGVLLRWVSDRKNGLGGWHFLLIGVILWGL